ncbi:hypothetical protein F4779DRAFT_621638 [Xylariaceae sp. FL0662B]|nr:hypothetical protein F4779DRAFT_621638 [Xylariaceae sp. FL0662B]
MEINHVIYQPTLQSHTSEEDSDDVFEDAQESWDAQSRPGSPISSEDFQQRTNRSDSAVHGFTLDENPQCYMMTREEFGASPFRSVTAPVVLPASTTSITHPPTPTQALSSTIRSVTGSSNAGPASQDELYTSKPCEVCEETKRDIWFCNVCTIAYCEQCWDVQVVHKKSLQGIPHEKTNADIAAKVSAVLSPPVDDCAREQLYRDDAPTAWFGVDRPDDLSPPMFQDYGRFTELMAATDPVRNNPSLWEEVDRDRRTPSLVSFVGQTGAGKSTLVKLLIDFAINGREIYSTPVVGPRGAHLPTSEDVHLYLDPKTADSRGPLLYADCEGLEGGEREPLGAKFKRKRRLDHSRVGNIEANLSKAKIISERELQWANEPRARSREFAVTNLYPRLLYTFSDVIVFVLRNPRVIEHVFERLVKWAAAAIETSSNQPVLPHAIIALNASEHDLDNRSWDVHHNTETILNDLAHTVNRNETFKKWAQFWRERGKVIDTLVDLVLCYYSSIQIIRLPAEGRPNLMEEQISKLYDGTLTASIAARSARYQARMLLDVEDLHAYLQEAFNHYSSTLESPFDFVQASFRNSPIPPDFGGNILKLALEMMNTLRTQRNIDARGIFSELSYMVASCIMLDSARHKNKGSASQIFPKYINHLDDALENFCDQHWPCEFVNPKTGIRCVNVRSGHTSKGHQTADGKVFAAGDWLSRFSFGGYRTIFRDWVYCCLVELLKELTTRVQENSESEEQIAAYIHKNMVLGHLYSHIKHSDTASKSDNYLVSHTTCFCCLFGQAEHFLPCGHVLCTACVNTYGNTRSINGIDMHTCPIDDVVLGRFSSWVIHMKPKAAGIRVMSLDGGGIRGIVELEVLRQIEMALGDVPIQCFTDLIVGTSTGGLVALGLASMSWTVDECINHFETLCHEAFTRRVGSSLPLIGSFVDNYHHSKYQTSTLEKAFKSAFTDTNYLFGGRRSDWSSGSPVKVAVTATSLAGNKTYVITNYNRNRGNHTPNHYHFQRPEVVSAELKVWEAARATTAAPRYFKSFHHEASQKTYIDGAVLHNNPVRIADSERKMLWPDHHAPDLLLSIGTGSSPTLSRSESEHMAAAPKGIFSHGRQLYSIMRSNLKQTLDCERAWEDYFAGVTTTLPRSFSTSRFLRINPIINEVPALDEKEKMDSLRVKVQESLRRDPQIKEVARQLIASTFYFELISVSEPEPDGTTKIQGRIQCRLLQPSREICLFGQHIKERTMGVESLRFVIFEDGDTTLLETVHLTPEVANVMMRDEVFNLRQVAMHPISGFPRVLIQGDENSAPGLSIPSSILHSTSCRYTHGSRRLKKFNDKWQPPDVRGTPNFFNLRNYASDPARTIGNDFMRMAELNQKLQPGSQEWMPYSAEVPENAGHQRARRSTIREAFKALQWPLRSQKPEAESHIEPSSLEPLLPENLKSQHGGSESMAATFLPSGYSKASLRPYNARSEESAVYRQWLSLLQPVVTREGGNNFSPTNYWSGNVTRSSSPERDCELDDAGPVELADTGCPVELDGTSCYPNDTEIGKAY